MAYDTTGNGEWTQGYCKGMQRQIKATQKLSDKQSTAILKDYLPKFQLTLTKEHKKFPPIMWLIWYVNSIDKEINSG